MSAWVGPAAGVGGGEAAVVAFAFALAFPVFVLSAVAQAEAAHSSAASAISLFMTGTPRKGVRTSRFLRQTRVRVKSNYESTKANGCRGAFTSSALDEVKAPRHPSRRG